MDHEERVTLRELLHAVLDLIRDLRNALKKYLAHTTLQGDLMANYQLTTDDSVVITLTDTDDVTGDVVTPDTGSVVATLSDTTDTAVVDPSGSFVTLTGSGSVATGKTITVAATVGGVASTPFVGTYDVVDAVDTTADPTTLTGLFGIESAPSTTGSSSTSSSSATLPTDVDLGNGTVLPAGSPLPAGTSINATRELVNTADNTIYTGTPAAS
jgi:hypothetical protein